MVGGKAARRLALEVLGWTLVVVGIAALVLPGAARAQDMLRIGVESGPTSLDPHHASLITNIAFARHVFEPLVQQDARQVLRPSIASNGQTATSQHRFRSARSSRIPASAPLPTCFAPISL